jgi:alpha-glucosidase
MLLLSLRGNVFLYQGEELGLPQADVPFEALQDLEAIVNWPLTLGRDGARTPLPWKRGATNSGFSSGRPWLPVDPRHDDLSVDMQETNQWSTLHFVRKLIGIRRDSAPLRLGSIEFLKGPDGVIAFSRYNERDRVLCAFNISTEEKIWKPAGVSAAATLASLGVGQNGSQLPDKLPALSGYIAQVIR